MTLNFSTGGSGDAGILHIIRHYNLCALCIRRHMQHQLARMPGNRSKFPRDFDRSSRATLIEVPAFIYLFFKSLPRPFGPTRASTKVVDKGRPLPENKNVHYFLEENRPCKVFAWTLPWGPRRPRSLRGPRQKGTFWGSPCMDVFRWHHKISPHGPQKVHFFKIFEKLLI
jgi:hypothetical protein